MSTPARTQAMRKAEAVHADAVVSLQISSLRVGESPRLDGESSQHIRILASSDAQLPPILVHRQTMEIIDGMHRLRAAILNGRQTIEVRFFDGTDADAFVAAVEANMAHGLPLTLADREAAAERIIASYPQHSDRWVAAITGLSAGTAAAIRRRISDGHCEITARVGRDGRVRPLNSADGRRLASEAISRHPEASLREVARLAGISPATVRDVRQRLERGDDPVPRRRPSDQKETEPAIRPPGQGSSRAAPTRPLQRDRAALLQDLRKDPSLRFTESGRALIRWLDARACGPGPWQKLIEAVPPHCAYLVAQLAHRCAAEWLEVAKHLEHELRSMS
jgi:ParB-like chromosome segregation protein Spo0J